MANMFINAMTDVWSVGGSTYNAIKMTVTNSASAAGSRILNLLVSPGTSVFSVDVAGNVAAAGTVQSTGAITSLAGITGTTITGTTIVANTAVNPDANDGAGLGTVALGWSDLDLANGGLLRWNVAGVSNYTVTHTSDLLTFSGALTVSGASTLAGGSSSGTWSNLGIVTTIDINGGTIDGTTIGATTKAAIGGTTGTFTGAVSMAGLTATTGAFTGALSATTGTFSSTVMGGTTTGTIANGSASNSLEVRSAGPTHGAWMTFHSPSNTAVNFGMDIDGVLRVGGYSLSPNSYRIYHAGSGAISHTGSISVTGTFTASSHVYSGTGGFIATGTTFIAYCNNGANAPIQATSTTITLLADVSMPGASDLTVGGTITASSDERLKTNIQTIENALDKVNALRGVSFTKDDETNIGVIAQEVLDVVPEVVRQSEDGYYGVAYGNMIGLLIEAVKELTAEVRAGR